MATLLPRELSRAGAAPPSVAQCRVHRALARLDSDWLVVHAPRWNTLDLQDRVISGSVDFVLAHPRLGVLALAVEEGGLAYDPTAGCWYALPVGQAQRPIPDPFRRAEEAASSLALAFARSSGASLPGPRCAHGLWLPDLLSCEGLTGIEALPALVATSPDLEDPETALLRMLRGFPEARPENQESGRRRLERIVAMLATPWEVRPLLGATLRSGQREILQLTEEQFQVLDLLAANRRVSVAGGAGTGKTMLALEKAARLAAAGIPTLLTCFNRPLGRHLHEAAQRRTAHHPGPGDGRIRYPDAFLSVTNFHEFAFERVHRWRPIAPSEPRTQEFWDKTLPTRFLEYLDAHPADRYDALVVDEGQDFSPREWTALELLLRDPRCGVFYIFHDENQAIFRDHSSVPTRGMVSCRLERNLRNTRTICEDLVRDFRGSGLKPAGPPGRPVERIPYPAGELLPALIQVLQRLVHEEGVRPGEIAVLSPRRHGSALPIGPLGPFPVQDGEGADSDRLVVETVQRFKGLERPVVILVELEDARPEKARKLRYTAASRACLHLIKMVRQAPST